jgi:hypothetical protein
MNNTEDRKTLRELQEIKGEYERVLRTLNTLQDLVTSTSAEYNEDMPWIGGGSALHGRINQISPTDDFHKKQNKFYDPELHAEVIRLAKFCHSKYEKLINTNRV